MEQQEWVLPLRDGTTIKIPPSKVANINKLVEAKEPIRIEGRLVLYQELAGGPRLYVPDPIEPGLLEDYAKATGTPVLNTLGEVECDWIKETVSANRWNKYYSQFASYFKLGNSYESVVIAYRIPKHLVQNSHEKCTITEVQQLEIKLANS